MQPSLLGTNARVRYGRERALRRGSSRGRLVLFVRRPCEVTMGVFPPSRWLEANGLRS